MIVSAAVGLFTAAQTFRPRRVRCPSGFFRQRQLVKIPSAIITLAVGSFTLKFRLTVFSALTPAARCRRGFCYNKVELAFFPFTSSRLSVGL